MESPIREEERAVGVRYALRVINSGLADPNRQRILASGKAGLSWSDTCPEDSRHQQR
jgi:hypothetical protein